METDEISSYLDSLSRDSSYRCISVLKTSDFETTERVVRDNLDGSTSGPFIRKTFDRDSGLGLAYEQVFNLQKDSASGTLPHIPQIIECYLRDGSLVVIMEQIPGITLQDLIYQQDPSLELAAEVFPQICDAVSVLHESFSPPLIHRDLKPSNIMVAQGRIYIIDFGITREYKEQSGSDTQYFGTRSYAPPEQFGFGQTTVRSDIYALGMLLYYCLTEKTPGTEAAQSGYADPRIPSSLRNVIIRATSLDPKDRYASVREMKAALEAALIEVGCKRVTDKTEITRGADVPSGAGNAAPFSDPNEQHTPMAEIADGAASSGVPGATRSFYASTATAQADAPFAPTAQMPHTTAFQPNEPVSRLGVVYNFVLVALYILMLAASAYTLFHLPQDQLDRPFWFNAFGYLFVVPSILTCILVPLLYKRPFVNRYPDKLGNIKTWHYFMASLALFFATILLLMPLQALANAT